MKIKLSISLIAILFSMFQLHADELKYRMADEAYINDIDFNTQLISNENKMNVALTIDFEMIEEEYIDDIPFDTHEILEMNVNKFETNMVFEIAEESYIDDIPFNTEKVVETLKINAP